MAHPSVSIVIPVYNVAPYLERCLDSIGRQSRPDFEVLLVDDGSTDQSRHICQQFVRKDRRFRLLTQENAGASAARNLAMDQAQGRYLQFVDGDDWLPPDSTQSLLHAAEATGCDLVVAHFYRVEKGLVAERGHIKKNRVMTRKEYAEEMVKAPANFYYGVMWNKLYRRAIVEADHLRCPADISWCEDFLFNLEYMARCRLVTAINTPVYYYLKREDSLVSTQATLRKTIATKRATFAEYKELYQQLDLYEEHKARVYRYLISTATDGMVGPLAPTLEGEKRIFGLKNPLSALGKKEKDGRQPRSASKKEDT